MSGQHKDGGTKADRKERLAEALRANLQKRKAQARERRNDEPQTGSACDDEAAD